MSPQQYEETVLIFVMVLLAAMVMVLLPVEDSPAHFVWSLLQALLEV